jgi:hypothetical protein
MDYTRIENTDKGIFIGKAIPVDVINIILEFYVDYWYCENKKLCQMLDVPIYKYIDETPNDNKYIDNKMRKVLSITGSSIPDVPNELTNLRELYIFDSGINEEPDFRFLDGNYEKAYVNLLKKSPNIIFLHISSVFIRSCHFGKSPKQLNFNNLLYLKIETCIGAYIDWIPDTLRLICVRSRMPRSAGLKEFIDSARPNLMYILYDIGHKTEIKINKMNYYDKHYFYLFSQTVAYRDFTLTFEGKTKNYEVKWDMFERQNKIKLIMEGKIDEL